MQSECVLGLLSLTTLCFELAWGIGFARDVEAPSFPNVLLRKPSQLFVWGSFS